MIFFIKFYGIYILSLAVFWATGWGIKKVLKIHQDTSYTTVLYNILTGLITFSAVIAIFYTKGKTVMVFSVLLGLLLYFFHKKEKTSEYAAEISNNQSLRQIVFNTFIGSSLIYTVFFFTYIKNGFVVVIYSDHSFYADLSYRIIHTGLEHCYTNALMPPNGVQPYHYLEIWLNGGIAKITRQNYLSVLLLVVYPVFVFLVLMGVCRLFSYASFKSKYLLWFAFLATFTTGIFFPDIPIYQYLGKKFYLDFYTRTLWDYHKYAIIYTFLIAAILLFAEKKTKSAYIVLLYVPIFYSTLVPSFLAGIGVFIAYLVIFRKENAKWLFIQYCILFGGLFVFYTIFQDKSIVISPDKIDLELKTKINIIGNTLLGIFFVYWYIPLLVLVFVRKKVVHMFFALPYAWFIVIIPFWGLLSWSVLNKNLDSVQVFSNITIPLLNITSIGVLLMLFKYKGRKIFFTVFVLLTGSSIYQVYHNYFSDTMFSDRYKEQVEKLKILNKTFENKPDRLGVFLRDTSEFNASLHYLNAYSSSIIFDMSCVFSDYYTVLLNVHEANTDAFKETSQREIAKKLIKISVFNRYVEKQKQQGKFVGISQSQQDFIKEYKVAFIATRSNYTLPGHLSALVKEKVDLGDRILYLLE